MFAQILQQDCIFYVKAFSYITIDVLVQLDHSLSEKLGAVVLCAALAARRELNVPVDQGNNKVSV